MKTLRLTLLSLAAPAALLFGLTQLGGTPIHKGCNTGFNAAVETGPMPRVALSTETGDLNCWVKLKLPATAEPVAANLSTTLPLSVYQESVDGDEQWVAIVAQGSKREEKFKWPSGARLFLSFSNGNNMAVSDWRVYLSDQAFDSKQRATWRKVAFVLAGICLALALFGGGLEARSRFKDERTGFSYEQCLKQLICTIEGKTPQQTEWMQSILTKVLLQGIKAKDAITPLPLKDYLKQGLWFKARDQFCAQLDWLISELTSDKKKLMKP
jgi:hypothetical protein